MTDVTAAQARLIQLRGPGGEIALARAATVNAQSAWEAAHEAYKAQRATLEHLEEEARELKRHIERVTGLAS